jgi:hypothetical protein
MSTAARWPSTGLLVLATLVVMVGCGGGRSAGPEAREPAGAASAPAAGTSPVAAGARVAPERARLIITSISLGATPNYIARDLGFWAEEGIEPDLVLVPGAATPAKR